MSKLWDMYTPTVKCKSGKPAVNLGVAAGSTLSICD